MHPNVAHGNKKHAEHFEAIHKNAYVGPGWKVYKVNKQINFSGLRPDWILLNHSEKRGFILDLTTKYAPKHYKKGQGYINELLLELKDPSWNIVYIEDYWLHATIH